MLALIGLDATPTELLDELASEGLVPRISELRQAASKLELTTPATLFAAGAFPTLWSGVPLGDHGIHYPFMWDASEQRVRYVDAFASPPMLWDRIARAGGKVLVVDAYEAPAPVEANGLVISGWQFANRIVLRSRSAPKGAFRAWEDRLGRRQRAEEVFGEPDERSLRRLAATLVAGPRRATDLVVAALPEIRPDLLVASLPSVHLAGHQLWDPAAVVDGISPSSARELQALLREVVIAADTAVGRIIDALPPGSDIVVHSALGTGVETSRTDVLGTMLAAVLDSGVVDSGQPSGSWRMRAAVPASVRGRVASALPDAVATALAARLELRGVEWSRTRAFPVPSDTNGTIRFNVKGREQAGIVDPHDVPALVAETDRGSRASPLMALNVRSPLSTWSPTRSSTRRRRIFCPISSSAGANAPLAAARSCIRRSSGRSAGTAWAAAVPATTPTSRGRSCWLRQAPRRKGRRMMCATSRPLPFAASTSRRPARRSSSPRDSDRGRADARPPRGSAAMSCRSARTAASAARHRRRR